jgi:type II secretory pathway pseudopilin PulG
MSDVDSAIKADRCFLICFLGMLLFFVWSAWKDQAKNDEAVQIADQQVQTAVEEQAERQSDTLTVPRATSTIVFVGDASSEYGRRWLANEAAQCESKGWQIKTVDLSGMADPKFFIYSGGAWMTHNGHLSLSSLSALVSRTTATQSQSTGPLPSVTPRRVSE